MVDAAYYLQVYDADTIFSWTPKEFKNFIKGAQLRQIDDYELSAYQALYIEMAHRSKRPKIKDLYDAKKARERLEGGGSEKKAPRDLTRFRNALAAMKNYRPQVTEKGG